MKSIFRRVLSVWHCVSHPLRHGRSRRPMCRHFAIRTCQSNNVSEDLISRLTIEEKISQTMMGFWRKSNVLGDSIRYDWWNGGSARRRAQWHGDRPSRRPSHWPRPWNPGIAPTNRRCDFYRGARKERMRPSRNSGGGHQAISGPRPSGHPTSISFRDPRWGRGQETYLAKIRLFDRPACRIAFVRFCREMIRII